MAFRQHLVLNHDPKLNVHVRYACYNHDDENERRERRESQHKGALLNEMAWVYDVFMEIADQLQQQQQQRQLQQQRQICLI